MTVNQNEFHPMAGHVDEDVIILMNNGDELVIKSSMKGWHLVKDGQVIATTQAGNALATIIHQYPRPA
jgi:hypothetical protein